MFRTSINDDDTNPYNYNFHRLEYSEEGGEGGEGTPTLRLVGTGGRISFVGSGRMVL